MPEELTTTETLVPWEAKVPKMLRRMMNPEDVPEGGFAYGKLIELARNMDAIIADLPGLAEALGKLEKQLPRDVKNFPQWDTVQSFVDKYGKKEPAQ